MGAADRRSAAAERARAARAARSAGGEAFPRGQRRTVAGPPPVLAAAHTWTPGCDGLHALSGPCPAGEEDAT